MPIILEEIRKYNKDVKISILIATGMHRASTHEELVAKYGEKIVNEETIVMHDAYVDEDMTFKGILPSGGELWVNKLIDSEFFKDALIYKDGGSRQYSNSEISILMCNTVSGNRDVYIGVSDMGYDTTFCK
jgi:nickel-dependent lactate racemase